MTAPSPNQDRTIQFPGQTVPENLQAAPQVTNYTPATITGLAPVRLNLSTTFQSPFFWILGGLAIGFWLGRTRKII